MSHKVLILGETGAGKTSFMELLKNYEVLQSGLNISKVKTHFIEQENSSSKSMSKTPLFEQMTIGDSQIDFIDTPGLADTEGDSESNIKLIIDKVKEAGEISCICLVINGTECRMTPEMTEVLTNLASILVPEILSNVIILFTNTQDKESINFDLNVLESIFKVSTKMNEQIFFIDNPYCRLKNFERIYSKVEYDSFQSEFSKTFDVVDQLLSTICKFKAVSTTKFGEYYYCIESMQALGQTLSNMLEKKEELEKNLVIVKKEKESIQDLYSTKENTKEFVILNSCQKNNICLVQDCSSNCHSLCKHWLHKCSVMQRGTCTICNHPRRQHKRVKLRFVIKKTLQSSQELDCLLQKKHDGEKSEKDNQMQLETCTQTISDIITQFTKKLKEFQIISPLYNFSGLPDRYFTTFEHLLSNFPECHEKEHLVKLIDNTRHLLENPVKICDTSIKLHWACGLLRLDPGLKITHDVIDRASKCYHKVYHGHQQQKELTCCEIFEEAERFLKHENPKITSV